MSRTRTRAVSFHASSGPSQNIIRRASVVLSTEQSELQRNYSESKLGLFAVTVYGYDRTLYGDLTDTISPSPYRTGRNFESVGYGDGFDGRIVRLSAGTH
ncbi:hypothetical protein MPER_06016 [Moniliophthora perniciosa FA553]|nr:hypothetical protein MPER_06016 [Moniliophthora perniciosa FA553]